MPDGFLNLGTDSIARRPVLRDLRRRRAGDRRRRWLRAPARAASCTRSAPTPTPPASPASASTAACSARSSLAGALAGLAGVLFAARFGTLDATAGTGYELTVVAAVVVGGVAIFGGTGTVYGAALGALLLGTITSALVVLKVNPFWEQATIGALLLVAIGLDRLLALRVARRPAQRGALAVSAETAAPPSPAEADATPVAGGTMSRIRAAAGRWETLLVGLIVFLLIAGSVLSDEFLTSDFVHRRARSTSAEVALIALPLT